jgi:acetyl esterase/lipase
MPNVSPVAVIALYTVMALVPLRRPPLLGFVSCMLSFLVNELPFIAAGWLLAWTLLALYQGELNSAGGLAYAGVVVLTMLGLAEVVRRALLAGPALERALARGLGTGPAFGPEPRRRNWRRLTRVLLGPFPLWSGDVQQIRNISYGEAGRRNRLDLYRPRRRPAPGSPVLIHFHGGGFQMGTKSRQSRPLLHRFARQGWVCLSATYRLRAAGRFPNSLVDAKKVIAWVRSHADEYGLDGSLIVVAGSSAGAHLAAMAALTPNVAAFQPSFEGEDTSVAAAVCLYGYYGDRDRTGPLPSSPNAYVGPDAPPFFLAHGDHDTLVPVPSADHFVEQLRSTSDRPVVYLKLPGGQHAFDLFHSLRYETVIDGIEAFTAWVRANRSHPTPAKSSLR